MALCTTPACGCAFRSESMTITDVNGLITIEQAGDSEITQLRDDLDALQSAYDAYIAANDADVAALSVSVAALLAAFPSASSTWAPTVAGITKTSGTEVARYVRHGPVIHCFYQFTFGASSAITGDVSITNPVTAISPIISGSAYVNGTARNHVAVYTLAGGGAVLIRAKNSSTTYLSESTLSSTVPFTWANTHYLAATWSYLAA